MKKQKKVIMITGAAKRIGKEIILRLPIEEYNFIVHFNRSKKEAKTLVRQIKDKGGDAKSIQFNLSNTKSIEKFCKSCEALYGRVDILINNASEFKSQDFFRVKEKDFDNMIGVNLKAPFFLSKFFSKGMKKRKYGKIINITDSIGTSKTWKEFSTYCISKGGLETMTKALALELSPYVQVNSVAPGAILKPVTRIKKIYRKKYTSEKSLQSLVDTINLLLSSDFITGESINVDGGERLI
tara:strand:- start:2734 stop:3453 length:720 start_codon:yes stop_codon:yes gene_type:complete